MKREALVSIIVPAYNCEQFIGTTIESVITQTYNNWELVIVDDCSTDGTAEVIMSYSNADSRIKYHKLTKNSGAASARNKAIDLANGRYMAFLDSDDVWLPIKLEKQITFMKENNYAFTCTGYNKINEYNDVIENSYIKVKESSDYNGVLHRCPGNSTVIYDAEKLGKHRIPEIRKRNDYVMWLQILKQERYLYGLDVPLGSHRIREGSISSNKFSLVKYHWIVYRDIEKLSIARSVYLISYWIIVSALKLR